jgi:hypothetical protein
MPYPVTVRGKRIWYAPWRRRPSLALMHADTVPMTGEQLAALGMTTPPGGIEPMTDETANDAAGFTIGEGFTAAARMAEDLPVPADSGWQPSKVLRAPAAEDAAYIDLINQGFTQGAAEQVAPEVVRNYVPTCAGKTDDSTVASTPASTADAVTTTAPAGEPNPFPGALRFRKLPVTIEAVRFLHVDPTSRQILFGVTPPPEWLIDACSGPEGDVGSVWAREDNVLIGTLEGHYVASPGDWIIRGVKNEVYACKPDIFAETYEPDMTLSYSGIQIEPMDDEPHVYWNGACLISERDLPQWTLDIAAFETAGETPDGPHLVAMIDGVRTLLRPGTRVTPDMFAD